MWYHLFIVIALVVISGIYAGLTLSLFGIQLTTLERRIKLGDEEAKSVYEIRRHGYLLLCSLLLGNVASYTVMAIYLGSITSSVTASIIATALIFIFGEIIPQALFPRYAVKIGAKLVPLVRFTIIVCYPIAAPIAWILNKTIGKEPPVLWSKQELGEIIKFHKEFGDGIIDKDEERIIQGALSFSELKALDIMIPRDEAFFLEAKTIIDENVTDKIKAKGFSRIPIYNNEKGRVESLLFVKDLLGTLAKGNIKADDVSSKKNLIVVNGTIPLDNLMNLLIHRKMHMAIVEDDTGEFKGIVTLEDIMEEILKTELEDHEDVLSK